MRQIKFRGKRLDTGKWVYGYLADGYYINDINAPVRTIIEVDSHTVSQYTGLYDRNGKEIYEGDILQDDEIVWEVFWCDDIAAFMVEQHKSETDAPKMFLLSDVAKDSEVIGNIHEQSKS